MATSPRERIALHETIQEVAQAIRSELPGEIRLRRQIEARGIQAAVDPEAIRSKATDLLSSAAGELIPGGGSLELSLIEVEIDDARFAARRGLEPGLYARLGVRVMPADPESDSRLFVGAPAEELGDPSLAELAAGFDELNARLLLHIVCGNLQIYSAYFPVQRSEPAREESLRRGCGTVLFVDDDDALVDIHRRSIESLGYEVIECTEARRALELIGRYPHEIDIVISDLGMPDMRGDELARRIRSVSPEIPIGLSTGLAVASGDAGGEGQEFEILLAKPFSLEELAEALDSLRRHGENAWRDESRG